MDLAQKLDAIEKLYVKHRILKDASGQAKIDFYKNVARTGAFDRLPEEIQPDTSLYRTRAWFNAPECLADLDTALIAASKFTRLNAAFTKATQKTGLVSPQIAVEAILSVLNAEDFESPLFRAYFLITLNFVLERETAYIRSIPKKLETPPNDANFNQFALTIRVNAQNEIHVNDSPCKEEDLAAKITPYIQTMHESDANHIRIQVSKETEYRLYAFIQETIDSCYQKVLGDYSHKQFGKHFDELTAEQRDTLKKQYPMRITEVRPK